MVKPSQRSLATQLRRSAGELCCAVQFLTRVPVPSYAHETDSLSRAVKFFPLVGMLVGAAASLLHRLLLSHINRQLVALLVLVFMIWITGCFHEDGLADTADGFGGGRTREQILLILRDSRIGAYGAAALVLSLVARLLLIASLPITHIAQYLVAAHVLCRWTTLPLSHYLPAARDADGQGARVAQLTTRASLIAASIFSFVLVGCLLGWHAISSILAALLITLLSGRFYMRKIGGVTGDCFGATNQLTEIAVYLCGAWML